MFDETCTERGLDKSISSTWIIKHNSDNNSLTINIKSKKERNDFVSLEGVRLFRTFSANLCSESKKITPIANEDAEDNQLIQNLGAMILREFQNIKAKTKKTNNLVHIGARMEKGCEKKKKKKTAIVSLV